MTWFKVGEELTFHPRVIKAGNSAMGLWIRAATWCSTNLTDGWIAHDEARQLGSAAEIKKLVAVGLWATEDRGDEAGYQFHRWATNGVGDKRQPSRAEVEADREKNRQRQELYRRRKAGDDGEPPPPVASGDGAVTPLVTPNETVDNSVSHATSVPFRSVPFRPEDQTPLADRRSTARVSGADFDRFYDVFPRKAGKEMARRSFERAAKRVGAEVIIAGALRFASDPNLPERQFIPHPATWLNAGRWDDEPLPSRVESGAKQQASAPMRNFN